MRVLAARPTRPAGVPRGQAVPQQGLQQLRRVRAHHQRHVAARRRGAQQRWRKAGCNWAACVCVLVCACVRAARRVWHSMHCWRGLRALRYSCPALLLLRARRCGCWARATRRTMTRTAARRASTTCGCSMPATGVLRRRCRHAHAVCALAHAHKPAASVPSSCQTYTSRSSATHPHHHPHPHPPTHNTTRQGAAVQGYRRQPGAGRGPGRAHQQNRHCGGRPPG
jgi:hypothetical protein